MPTYREGSSISLMRIVGLVALASFLLHALARRWRIYIELPHFAAEHLVVDLGDAVEGDVAHVDAVARLDEERQRQFLVGRVTDGGGHRVHRP